MDDDGEFSARFDEIDDIEDLAVENAFEDDRINFLFVRLDTQEHGRPFRGLRPTAGNDTFALESILPSAGVFPWQSATGLSADPSKSGDEDEMDSCTWNAQACPNGKELQKFLTETKRN